MGYPICGQLPKVKLFMENSLDCCSKRKRQLALASRVQIQMCESSMDRTGLKFESWKVRVHTQNASQHLYLFIYFFAFWKKSKSWNLVVAWEVPAHGLPSPAWPQLSVRLACWCSSPYFRFWIHSAIFWLCDMNQPGPLPFFFFFFNLWRFSVCAHQIEVLQHFFSFKVPVESLRSEARAKRDVLWHLAISRPKYTWRHLWKGAG